MDDVLRAGGGASHRPERPDAARGHRGHLRVGEHRLLGGFPGLLDGGVIRINVMLEAFPFTEPVGDVEGRGIRGVAGGHCAFLSWVDVVAKLVEALGLGLLASGLLTCEPLFPESSAPRLTMRSHQPAASSSSWVTTRIALPCSPVAAAVRRPAPCGSGRVRWWLVKDDEVLAAHQCRADGNPLLLPAGQAHRMPFGERCKVKIGHDLIGLSGDAGIRLVESDEQFLAHAVGEQLVVDILHDQESGAGQVARFRGHAVELDAARNRLDESGQRAHERGLAAAVVAHEPGDFAGTEPQVRDARVKPSLPLYPMVRLWVPSNTEVHSSAAGLEASVAIRCRYGCRSTPAIPWRPRSRGRGTGIHRPRNPARYARRRIPRTGRPRR